MVASATEGTYAQTQAYQFRSDLTTTQTSSFAAYTNPTLSPLSGGPSATTMVTVPGGTAEAEGNLVVTYTSLWGGQQHGGEPVLAHFPQPLHK